MHVQLLHSIFVGWVQFGHDHSLALLNLPRTESKLGPQRRGLVGLTHMHMFQHEQHLVWGCFRNTPVSPGRLVFQLGSRTLAG